MTGDAGLAADRASFRQHCLDSDEIRRSGDVETANSHVDQLIAIARQYGETGRASELLVPLLGDSSPGVRYAASGHLLRLARNDDDRKRALSVLEDLRDHDETTAGSDAIRLLDIWRAQH